MQWLQSNKFYESRLENTVKNYNIQNWIYNGCYQVSGEQQFGFRKRSNFLPPDTSSEISWTT